MTPVMQAMVALVRHHGGAAAVGRQVGMSDLADRLNPNARAKLGLDDAVQIELTLGDCRLLYAHAEECGHFAPIPRPEGCDADVAPCMQTLARTAQEFADLVATVSGDLADGQVSDNDLARARSAWSALQLTAQQLMRQLASLNQAAKPQVRS